MTKNNQIQDLHEIIKVLGIYTGEKTPDNCTDFLSNCMNSKSSIKAKVLFYVVSN